MWTEQVPTVPGGSHQEGKQIIEGPLKWDVIRAVGELRVGLRTNEESTASATMATWLISRYNQGKLKGDLSPLPSILLYFQMGWTPGKINMFSLLSFSFLG